VLPSVEHERTQTAAAEARATGMPPSDVAKTVVLRDEEGVRLAVVSGRHLDRYAERLYAMGEVAAGPVRHAPEVWRW
jgi:hypothetical protein